MLKGKIKSGSVAIPHPFLNEPGGKFWSFKLDFDRNFKNIDSLYEPYWSTIDALQLENVALKDSLQSKCIRLLIF